MPELDHERCSELLGGYLEGSLEGEHARAVERHLTGCEACRAERAALEALARVGDAPMTTDECAALRAAVDHHATSESEAEVVPLARARGGGGRRGFSARLGPALGAAALVALIAVGVATLGDGVTSPSEDAGSAGGGAGVQEDAGRAPENQSEPFGAPESGITKAAPQWIGSLGSVTRAELSRKGETGAELRALAYDYAAPRARSKLATVTDALVTRAPAELESRIRACVKEVAKLGYTTLPAFGARAQLEGRDVLVLGFVWTSAQGSLDRFMVWAFAGASCDTVSYQAGPVTPAKG